MGKSLRDCNINIPIFNSSDDGGEDANDEATNVERAMYTVESFMVN